MSTPIVFCPSCGGQNNGSFLTEIAVELRPAPPNAMRLCVLLVLALALDGCQSFRSPGARRAVFRSGAHHLGGSTSLPAASATTEATAGTGGGGGLGALLSDGAAFAKTVWDFSRPHTVVGSGISLVSVFLFSCSPSSWSTPRFRNTLLSALLPSLAMNLYITGLNQVTDIELDKINKDYLPLASGALRKSHGISIVIASLLASLWISRAASWPMKLVLWGSCALGSAYSLPPLRLKRFPMLAAFCILVVRGALVNMGFFLEAKLKVAGVSEIANEGLLASFARFPESVALSVFFAVFGLVIAVAKDVPDVKGDRIFSIQSFSVRFGARRAFEAAWRLLVALLGGSGVGVLALAAVAGVRDGGPLKLATRVLLGGALNGLAWDVWRRSVNVDPDNSQLVFSNYMSLWNTFYACYLLLPLAALSL